MRSINCFKKYLILPIIAFAFLSGKAQDSITITETTFKMKGNKEESLFYGLAEGDKVIIQFEEAQGKPIKEFEVIESPSHSKLKDIDISSINKELCIPRTAVYEFRFKTAFMSPRTCRFSLSRIPKDSTTINFNTAWEWKTIYDTAYIPYTIDSIVGYDTIYYKETVKEIATSEMSEENILDESILLGAQMSLSGAGQTYQKSFSIPSNNYNDYSSREVVSWAYWIGVGEESQQAWQRGVNAVKGLTEAAASSFITPLGAAAMGVAFDWAMASSGEDVQYSIVNQYGNIFSQGDCISTAKTITDSHSSGEYTIRLYNDNVMQKLNVRLRVVAIVRTKTYHDVVYDRKRIDTRTITLNKTRMEITPRQIRVNAQ